MNNIEEKIRHIFLYKDYFTSFYNQQKTKVKEKILWTFKIIEVVQQVPKEYLKYIEDTEGLYEIRIHSGTVIVRFFCFFDEGQLVVIANGFRKKTKKTPKQEIHRAIKIKEEYEQEKMKEK
jgi:phage-related protein